METRANYLLIGVFTLAGILAGLGFLIWLARLQINQQFDYYDVLFDNVSGLSRAAEVRFNGLPVGQVLTLSVYQNDPNKVRVRIEVAANTPIREDTKAQLSSQGVTGVSYVALSGGTPGAPLLRQSVHGVPVIFGQPSVVEQLTQDVPDLLSEAITLLRSVQQFMSQDNQAYVSNILSNLDTASGQLETALGNFSTFTTSVSKATEQIGAFTGRLEQIGGSVQSTLSRAEQTLEAAEVTFGKADTTLEAATGAFTSAQRTIDDVGGVVQENLPGIAADLTETAGTLRTAVTGIDAEVRNVLGQVGSVAGAADARLVELKTTVAALDSALAEARTALASIEQASTSVHTLVDGEATALVTDAREALAEARTSIDAINLMVTEDVPTVVADVQSAVATANRVIDQVGGDVTEFTGRLEPLTATAGTTLDAATTTFRDASATLARIDTALTVAEGTLAAAETTFTDANRLIGEEVAPTAADIRAAAAELGAAVTKVSGDLPAITGDLRATLTRATEAIDRMEAVVTASAGPVQDFTTTGLPQFTRFAIEARGLVTRLDRIADRLERDPARFLLGGQGPTYRR